MKRLEELWVGDYSNFTGVRSSAGSDYDIVYRSKTRERLYDPHRFC